MKRMINIIFQIFIWFPIITPTKIFGENVLINMPIDTCYLSMKKDTVLIIGEKKFFPIYINYDYIELLGWFCFSDKKILYISPVYKSKTLFYKKASKIQILFSRSRKCINNSIYYFGRFGHCKTTIVKKKSNYLLRVEWIDPPPSHADVLKEIELSRDLKTMKLKISFMGSSQQLCILNRWQ